MAAGCLPRRTVQSFFLKIRRLQQAGFLEDAEVKILVSPVAAELLLKHLEPVARRHHDTIGVKASKEYDSELFDYFDELFDREIDRPLRSVPIETNANS